MKCTRSPSASSLASRSRGVRSGPSPARTSEAFSSSASARRRTSNALCSTSRPAAVTSGPSVTRGAGGPARREHRVDRSDASRRETRERFDRPCRSLPHGYVRRKPPGDTPFESTLQRGCGCNGVVLDRYDQRAGRKEGGDEPVLTGPRVPEVGLEDVGTQPWNLTPEAPDRADVSFPSHRRNKQDIRIRTRPGKSIRYRPVVRNDRDSDRPAESAEEGREGRLRSPELRCVGVNGQVKCVR